MGWLTDRLIDRSIDRLTNAKSGTKGKKERCTQIQDPAVHVVAGVSQTAPKPLWNLPDWPSHPDFCCWEKHILLVKGAVLETQALHGQQNTDVVE